MIKLLPITLCLLLSVTPTIERCYHGGYIYTIAKGIVVDSVSVETLMAKCETERDIEKRILEKEKIIEIIKTKQCKF